MFKFDRATSVSIVWIISHSVFKKMILKSACPLIQWYTADGFVKASRKYIDRAAISNLIKSACSLTVKCSLGEAVVCLCIDSMWKSKLKVTRTGSMTKL